MWKWVIATFFLFVGICGGGGFLLSQTPQYQDMMKRMREGEAPLEVRIESVKTGEIARLVSAPGLVEPETVVQISAQVSARITALPFREGDVVAEGDVIVRLDSRDLEAALESAQASKQAEEARARAAEASLESVRGSLATQEAQVGSVEAALARAMADLNRTRELVASGDRPRSDLELADAEYARAVSARESARLAVEIAKQELQRSTETAAAARFSIAIAQANIRRAEKDLSNTVISSPIRGTITQLNAEVGELVVVGTLNNAASVIMEIADLGTMLMRAEVDESNIAPIREGQPATVYINAYPDKTYTGRVQNVRLKRQFSQDTRAYYFETEVALGLAEGEQLRSGLRANCDIEVDRLFDVMLVPSQAVADRRTDDLPEEIRTNPLIEANRAFTQVVYKVVDGKAVASPIRTGLSDLTRTVVTAGLADGDRVIVGPYKVLGELKEGKRVVEETEKKKGADAKQADE